MRIKPEIIYLLRIVFVVIIFIFAFFVTGCNSSPEKENSIIEAEFMVDSSLISEKPIIKADLEMSVHIPKNWVEMDADMKNALSSSILTNDYAAGRLESGYFNVIDTSMMLLLDITGIDRSVFSYLKNNYKEVLDPNGIWIDTQFTQFRHNCYTVHQYVTQNERLFNFKIVFNRSEDGGTTVPQFELMYLLNRNYLEKNIRSIESSIGSIQCLTL